MRLGVYGGTFDPFHKGHLAVAGGLSARFRFDLLLLAPSAAPPHKQGRKITHPCHRVAMVALSTFEREDWVVSTVEIDCEPPHYTVDTVAKLHRRYPEAVPLYFIMGADSFEDLDTWREYLRLVESCHIIVTARPGHELDADHLPEEVHRRLVDLRGIPVEAPVPHSSEPTSIYLTDDTFVDISSTQVREAAREGRPLGDLVPKAVADYITKQELYSDTQ